MESEKLGYIELQSNIIKNDEHLAVIVILFYDISLCLSNIVYLKI